MANQFESAPHLFEEEDLRHLLLREVQRSTRYQDFLTLCLVRIAHPQQPPIPERQASLARQIAELLRSTDIVGTIGSDIAVLLVHTPYSDAVLISDRIRERGQREGVSLSTGLGSFPTDATSEAGLLAHAQAQLEASQRT